MSSVTCAASLDKHQVRQHFSVHAQDYNRYAQIQKRVVERLVELLTQHGGQFNTGLEVGSGTGLLGSRFRKTFPHSDLVMSDLAHGMSCASRATLPDSHVCDADAVRLPFLSNSFDFLISSSVYQWVEDLPTAFAEASRVLKPGGLLGLALFGERTLYELKDAHRQALQGKPSHVQTFPSPADVQQALTPHFRVEHLFAEDEVEWHADVPQLLRNLKRIGAQNSNSNRPSGLASRRTMQTMYQVYQQKYGNRQGIPATYQVIYLLVRN